MFVYVCGYSMFVDVHRCSSGMHACIGEHIRSCFSAFSEAPLSLFLSLPKKYLSMHFFSSCFSSRALKQVLSATLPFYLQPLIAAGYATATHICNCIYNVDTYILTYIHSH